MLLRRSTGAVLCLLAATLTLGGCFLKPEGEREGHPGIDFPGREGLAIPLGGIEYNVFITRQLNTEIDPDNAYYEGPPAPPGAAYYGVFVQACNQSDEPHTTVSSFKLKDNREVEFLPKRLPRSNSFAYNSRRLDPGECIPAEGSPAQQGPTAGTMLLFELPLAATENRPVELEIADGPPEFADESDDGQEDEKPAEGAAAEGAPAEEEKAGEKAEEKPAGEHGGEHESIHVELDL